MRVLGLALLSTVLTTACGCATLVTAREDFSLSEPWQNYERVVLRTTNGRVEIASAAGSGGASITGAKHAGGATLDDAQTNLSEVRILTRHDDVDPRTLFVELVFPDGLRNRNVGASFVVTVPQPVAAEISTSNGPIVVTHLKSATLRTSNGRVTATDIEGRLDARTSNGRIEVEHIGGDADLQTSNGSVLARGVRGRTKIDTSNGAVEARDVAGDIECETSNGTIVVDARPPVEGRLTLVSSNGNIRATVPQELKGGIDLSTSNGRLTTNLGNATLSRARWSTRRLVADMNGGGAGQIKARTSNGSIALECR